MGTSYIGITMATTATTARGTQTSNTLIRNIPISNTQTNNNHSHLHPNKGTIRWAVDTTTVEGIEAMAIEEVALHQEEMDTSEGMLVTTTMATCGTRETMVTNQTSTIHLALDILKVHRKAGTSPESDSTTTRINSDKGSEAKPSTQRTQRTTLTLRTILMMTPPTR